MAGLGLAGAVEGYMAGQQYAQQQERYAQQQEQVAKQRDIEQRVERAKKSALGLLDKQKATWAANGAQGEFQPSEDTNLKMAEAYGRALADEGLFDHYMENRARVAPMVLQARGKALQQYNANGDAVKLALALGPTYFNGKDVVGAERIGGDENGGPESVSIKFAGSDKPEIRRVDELVKELKVGLTDPQTWLKNEATRDLEAEKTRLHTRGRLEEIDAQGKNQLAVETKRGENRIEAEDVKGEHALARAHVRGQYGTETARIRGEFQSLASKARSGSGGRTSDDVARFKALELSARSSMESIRKELAAKEGLLKDAGSKDRPRIVAAVEALKSELDDARSVHSEIISTMRQPSGGGLADAAPRGESGAAPAPGAVASEPAAAGLAAITPAQRAASDAAEQQPGQVLDRKTLDAEIAKHPVGSDQRKVLEAERERLSRMPTKPGKGLAAASPASAPAKKVANDDKFVKGKVYKDAKGNRARYAGDGKWDPA